MYFLDKNVCHSRTHCSKWKIKKILENMIRTWIVRFSNAPVLHVKVKYVTGWFGHFLNRCIVGDDVINFRYGWNVHCLEWGRNVYLFHYQPPTSQKNDGEKVIPKSWKSVIGPHPWIMQNRYSHIKNKLPASFELPNAQSKEES